MDTSDLLKLIGGGSSFAALLTLIYLVGMRIVKALDSLISRVEAHETREFEHHIAVESGLADLRARFDIIQDVTPVEAPKRSGRTNPRGVPIGEYAYRRAGTKDGNER